jgi:Zn finger protein HypA/HybF involved in hydrogenase expression
METEQHIKPQKFLFRCDECECIFSVPFETEQDIQDVHDNLMILECGVCGGKAIPLRD